MVQDSSAVPFTDTSTVLYTVRVQYIAREQMAIAHCPSTGSRRYNKFCIVPYRAQLAIARALVAGEGGADGTTGQEHQPDDASMHSLYTVIYKI